MAVIMSVTLAGYTRLNTTATTIYLGGSTEERIDKSFKNAIENNYNCFFLGNSRVYRNINPDKFTSVNAYNFGHDNDTFNQMYYKLRYLVDNDVKIDYLIIEADYFSFSYFSESRKDIYAKYFDDAFLEDYNNYNINAGDSDDNNDDVDDESNDNESYYQKFKEFIINKLERLQFGLPYCLYYLTGNTEMITDQKDNGQYIAHEKATDYVTVDRDYSVLPIQYNYYEKIIELCETKGIDLYVVMAPLQQGETASHTDSEREEFNDMITKSLEGTPFEGHYINHSKENGLTSYTEFTDGTHLNATAADRYSEWLNSRIFGE
jgi:hypothetical protein